MLKNKLVKGSIISTFIILLSFTFGCEIKGEYHFSQPINQISAIEIVYRDKNSNFNIRKEVEFEYQAELISAILELPCYKYFNDPSTTMDDIAIRISYNDGCCDYLSSSCVAYYCNNRYKFGWVYFNTDDFNELLNKYLNN